MVEGVSVRPGWVGQLQEFYSYRELLINLTIRDLRVKYKGSVLGVAWSLLNPLLQMAIYTLIFSLFLRIVVLPNFWAFVVGGILVWTFFSTCMGNAAPVFVRNPNLISKVYFPIECLPLSMVLANFVNFLIPMAILVPVLFLVHIPLGPSLALLPIIMIAQLLMSIGLSLIVASLTVYLRDIEHFLLLGLQVLFYASPILYPLRTSMLPHGAAKFVTILHLNPLSWYLNCYHDVLFFGQWPDGLDFWLMVAFSLVSLVGGYLVFLALRPRLPESV
ncbi:MAG: ABC transporter permease [Acidimicrobiaceae bacterium]|nr:ABC transporter permease [Acidimicrobiaceae bacterium]